MITVIIPTSPSITHPDTSIIDTCIASVRKYLPNSPIIITFDGVRKELEHHTERYKQYREKMLEKYGGEMELIFFTNHVHQSGMIREAIAHVKTDQIFYIEHDWELVGEIPFRDMSQMIVSGIADLVRILYPTELPSYYMDKMIDQEPQIVCDIPVVRTFQWSQNPHLASTEFYRRIIEKYMDPNKKGYIEESMLAPVQTHYEMAGWGEFKTFIYVPEGNTQRCMHLDGRKGEVHNF